MKRVEAANRSLTVAAPNLVSEFSATFGANFMMQVLTVEVRDRLAIFALVHFCHGLLG